MQMTLIFILIISIVTAILFAIDKYRATKQYWRIPEAVLLFCSALGGAVGGIIAMCVCHHKTQKPIFYTGLPMIMIAQMLILILISNIFLY